MKLELETIDETTPLKYRVPVPLKTELDAVYKACEKRRPKLNFGAALSKGLWEVVKALKQELETHAEPQAEAQTEARAEPKTEPKHRLINGTDSERA